MNDQHTQSLSPEALETVTGGLGISGEWDGAATGSVGRVTGFYLRAHPTVCVEVGGKTGCATANAEIGASVEFYKR